MNLVPTSSGELGLHRGGYDISEASNFSSDILGTWGHQQALENFFS